MESQRVHYDYWLLITTVLLVVTGIVMVYSSSSVLAADRFGDAYFFLKKQLMFVFMGVTVAFVVARIPYGIWRRAVYPLLGIAAGALLLSYLPGFRSVASGAARWVSIAGIRFQPSEFAKVAFVIFMAYSIEKKSAKMHRFGIGVLSHLFVGGILMLLVFGQRDFGAAFTLGTVMMLLLYTGGARKIYLAAIALSSMPLVYFAIFHVEYRRQRILAFLDPWSDRYGSGFQIIQSLISFQQGGLFGRGLGEGQQKLFYLPEAHTDFIAAVLGEELGLMGIYALVTLFMLLTVRGVKVALRAPDLFGRYLALGLTMLLAIQAIANLAVVMGLLPTKGMVLPFISYGGSSLMVTFFSIGLLLSVSTYVGREEKNTSVVRPMVVGM